MQVTIYNLTILCILFMLLPYLLLFEVHAWCRFMFHGAGSTLAHIIPPVLFCCLSFPV